MWTREDIQRAARAAREKAIQDQTLSVERLTDIMLGVAARMALDNAATTAERIGDPEIRDAIDALKDQFPLGDTP